LWVRRVTHSEHTLFDVFDPAGRYLWSVDSPWSIVEFWHPVIVKNSIYTVVLDSLGVSYVVRGRLKAKSN
ncbi:MAG: hypothetical protein ACE5HT_14590, partial [Gemmatimonadales bacterium]